MSLKGDIFSFPPSPTEECCSPPVVMELAVRIEEMYPTTLLPSDNDCSGTHAEETEMTVRAEAEQKRCAIFMLV